MNSLLDVSLCCIFLKSFIHSLLKTESKKSQRKEKKISRENLQFEIIVKAIYILEKSKQLHSTLQQRAKKYF